MCLYFLSWVILLMLYQKSTCPMHECLDFSPMLSSRSLIVSYFTNVKPVVRLELLFVNDVKSVSRFTVLQVDVHLFKRPWRPLPYWLVFAILSDICWPYVCGSLAELSILFHWSSCLFFCQYHTTVIVRAL